MVAQASENKGVVFIGADGRCDCSVADSCPYGRIGHESRCLRADLIGVKGLIVCDAKRPVDPNLGPGCATNG